MAENGSAGEPMVSFTGVQKSYDGESLVVKDLNLDIAKGRIFDNAWAVRLRQDHLFDDAGGL